MIAAVVAITAASRNVTTARAVRPHRAPLRVFSLNPTEPNMLSCNGAVEREWPSRDPPSSDEPAWHSARLDIPDKCTVQPHIPATTSSSPRRCFVRLRSSPSTMPQIQLNQKENTSPPPACSQERHHAAPVARLDLPSHNRAAGAPHGGTSVVTATPRSRPRTPQGLRSPARQRTPVPVGEVGEVREVNEAGRS